MLRVKDVSGSSGGINDNPMHIIHFKINIRKQTKTYCGEKTRQICDYVGFGQFSINLVFEKFLSKTFNVDEFHSNWTNNPLLDFQTRLISCIAAFSAKRMMENLLRGDFQPNRMFEWRKYRIRSCWDSHKISQQWIQKYIDKYANFVFHIRKSQTTHHTNTFSFSLIRLFWRSVGLWGGEEVVVEPGGAARGDGAGHGCSACHGGGASHGDCSVNQFWLFPCYYSIFNVMLSLFVQESTQLRQFEGRFQSRCKSASLQSLCQVFKTWPCCQAEYQS